jgi:hypothetical protein
MDLLHALQIISATAITYQVISHTFYLNHDIRYEKHEYLVILSDYTL